MRLLLAGCAAALALGACGDTEVSNERQITVRSAEQDALFEASPVNRDIAMKRAINATGIRCDRVLRSGYVTDYENVMMWTATCDDDRDYAVFVGAENSAQVRLCDDVVEAGLPACEITRADSEGQNMPELGEVEPGSNEPDPEAVSAAPESAPAP